MVRELSTEVGSQAADGIPGQKGQASGVPAPSSSENERCDAEDEPYRVQKRVRYPHPPRPAAQVAPVGEPGHGSPECSHHPERERSVGRVSHGPGVCREVQPVEGGCCGPGAYGYVRERRVQRRLEPDTIQYIARRRPACLDGILHLRLDTFSDPVQKGQGVDHALHERLWHVLLPPFREQTYKTYTRRSIMPSASFIMPSAFIHQVAEREAFSATYIPDTA